MNALVDGREVWKSMLWVQTAVDLLFTQLDRLYAAFNVKESLEAALLLADFAIAFRHRVAVVTPSLTQRNRHDVIVILYIAFVIAIISAV